MLQKLSFKEIFLSKNIFLPLSVVLLFSLVVLSSISEDLFYRQALFIALGFVIVLTFRKFDFLPVLRHRWLITGIYAASIFFLVLVLLIGPDIRNVKSWLVLGPIGFQPSEIAKVALILVLSDYFSRRHLSVARWKIIFTSFLFFIVPAVLVAAQPALGSAAVLFVIWFGFLLSSGLPRNRILLFSAAFVVFGILLWNWGLKDYQKDRITHFFYPEKNVLGANYSVVQSKVAIGSAGLWGEGYRQGSQTQLGFLAEPTNDFILAALTEEWGLAGGLLTIGAFFMLMFGIMKTASAAVRNFDKFVCLGTVISLGTQFFLNSGSALGIVPVVGIQFPFLSYGGSSVLTNFFLIAIISSIGKK